MSDLPDLATLRDRSRSARERSSTLRVTSQQLRESLEHLRAYAGALGDQGIERHEGLAPAESYAQHAGRIPLDFAALMRERVQKARSEAQSLRRRAASLRQQAAESRARAENLRGTYSFL